MTAKELDYVRQTIDQEGFDYAFVDYSDYPNIQDEEFHRLRKAYVEAHKALYDFLNMDEFLNS
jgi:hypothetical protein